MNDDYQLSPLARARLFAVAAEALGLNETKGPQSGLDRVTLARLEAFCTLPFPTFCEACAVVLDLADASGGASFIATVQATAAAVNVTPEAARFGLRMLGAEPRTRDPDTFVFDRGGEARELFCPAQKAA